MKKVFSLILVLALMVSMMPAVYAAEITDAAPPAEEPTQPVESSESAPTTENQDPSEATEPPSEEMNVTEATETPETSEVTEPSEAPEEADATEATETTEATDATEPEVNEDPMMSQALIDSGFVTDQIQKKQVGIEDPGDYGISTFRVQKMATLRNCDPMDFICKDGTRQGFHYADEDGKAPWDYMNMIYCLESNKSFSVGSGHAGVGELPFDGSGSVQGEKVWYKLTADQRVAIGLILLYGAPTKLWDESWGINTSGLNMQNPNVGYRYATQALIWEIANNMREAVPPYKRTNSYWYDNAVGQCMSADGSTDHFLVAYNSIVSDMQLHNVIPSFTGDFAASAPEIQMTGNSTSVTDSNKVLSKFTFTNGNGVSYSKNGNTLTISVSGAVPTAVQSATATLPDPMASLYEVWYNQYDSSKQTCIKVSVPASDPVPAYFKLKASNGSLSLKKTTEDGKNLAGWQFSIYSDQNCTKLISGPHTTDSNGNISVANLTAGQVWVKEIGHTNADIAKLYYCGSTNPQAVTIVAGQTASVSFHNKLSLGVAKIVKTATNGGSVSGWHFTVKNSSGTVVGTYVTDSSGVISVSLLPGTYTVTETDGAYKYWVNDPTPTKTITVKANETATVTFTNQYRGQAQIVKTATNGGSVSGWHFTVKDSSGKKVGDYVTDSTGIITLDLEPGTYTVTETDGAYKYWVNDPTPTKTVKVVAGQTAKVTFQNQWRGQAQIVKTATNGGSVAGWHFEVKDSNGKVVGNYQTDSTGIITLDLEPGKYTVTETDGVYKYWLNDPEPTKTVTVVAGQTTKVAFQNQYRGQAQILKAATNGGSVEGWHFSVFTADGTKIGDYVTDSTGIITLDLEPGVYTVKETDGKYTYWHNDPEPEKTVTVVAGQTSSVTFLNKWIGKAKIVKTLANPEAGTVEGWQFTISRIVGEDTEYLDTVTTSADGTIDYDLEPGKYLITELIEENSLWECITDQSVVIEVKAGQTTEVPFTNALRPGKISIHKVDTRGESLGSTEFTLEWSEDGINWMPVSHTDSAVPQIGGCTTTGLLDGGRLVTDETGLVSFEGLYPTLHYRLTETKAKEGYQLLGDYAYVGSLCADKDFTVSLRVVNAKVFTLPETGSNALALMPIGLMLCAAVCMGALFVLKKKEI